MEPQWTSQLKSRLLPVVAFVIAIACSVSFAPESACADIDVQRGPYGSWREPIVDGHHLVIPLQISAGSVVERIRISISDWHWDHRQLRITLEHPDATVVEIFAPRFTSFAHDLSVDSDSSPELRVLTGKPTRGLWRLRFEDLISDGHDGFVKSVNLSISEAAP